MKFLCVRSVMETFLEKQNCKKVFLNFYAPKFRNSVKTKETESSTANMVSHTVQTLTSEQSQEPEAEPGVQIQSHLTFSDCFV